MTKPNIYNANGTKRLEGETMGRWVVRNGRWVDSFEPDPTKVRHKPEFGATKSDVVLTVIFWGIILIAVLSLIVAK